MIPGIGPVLGPAIGGAVGAKIRGGDTRDMLLGAATGALGGKMMQGMGSAGNVENLLADPATFGAGGVGVDALTKAGLDPTLLAQGTGGVDPMTFLDKAGASAKQLGMFKETFAANNPLDWKAATAADKFGALKGGGLGGLKSGLMTLPGLGTIAGTGLGTQRDMTRRFEEQRLKNKEEAERIKAETYAMYPENIPYRGGGSIYKNRYINGNWS